MFIATIVLACDGTLTAMKSSTVTVLCCSRVWPLSRNVIKMMGAISMLMTDVSDGRVSYMCIEPYDMCGHSGGLDCRRVVLRSQGRE